MVLWMGSPGHRANILQMNFREIGVGYVNDGADVANVRRDLNGDCVSDTFGTGPWFHYWTQNFGRRTNVYPVVINREAYETSNQRVSLYVYGADFAVDMRFRNGSGAFSSWEAYDANKAWTLSSGGGLKEVFAEIRNGGTVRSASDTIILTGPTPAIDFYTLDPCRAIDSRGAEAPALAAGAIRTFTMTGRCGIPATATALSVNVAVTGSPGNPRIKNLGDTLRSDRESGLLTVREFHPVARNDQASVLTGTGGGVVRPQLDLAEPHLRLKRCGAHQENR